MRIDGVLVLGAVMVVSGVAQAQDRWVRHFNQRVAAFEAHFRTGPCRAARSTWSWSATP